MKEIYTSNFLQIYQIELRKLHRAKCNIFNTFACYSIPQIETVTLHQCK